MKKLLFVSVITSFVAACGGGGSSNSAEPVMGSISDRATVSELINHSSDRGFSDCLKKLTATYADEVEDLSCTDMGIIDTQGLQYFENLISLALVSNEISKIDLSKNTNLKELNLLSNNLSSIDLSNNSKISSLVLSNNNLIQLDVSNLIGLEFLYVYENRLEALNISQNKKLITLNATINQLKNIDLSNNQELISLSIGDNKITEIDFLQSSPDITDLDISENKIKHIDLSKQIGLKFFLAFDNQLEKLTGVSEEHIFLNHINLMNNQFNAIPVGLFDIPDKNAFIQLSKNPLSVNAIAELNTLSATFSKLRFND